MKLHGSSSTIVAASALLICLSISMAAFAATSPSLGTASTFGVLSSTYTNTILGTTINGDLGYTTGPAVAPTVNGTTHLVTLTYNQAGIDQGAALTNLNGQACTFTFAPGVVDLSTDITHGPIGVYTPGVYCIDGAASIGTGGITLNGSGTYIFRITGALTTVANSSVTLSGGTSACDVFWTPMQATTLAANSSFIGTLIDDAGITAGANVTWTGNALAFSGTVTTDMDSITAPECSVPVPPTPVTVTCAPDDTSARTGETISWTATPSGGDGINYTYVWTGTDGLTGTLNPLENIYSTTGTKTASVIVTSGGLSSAPTVCAETTISRRSSGGGGGGYTPPIKPPVVIVPAPVIVPPVVIVPAPVIVPLLPNTGLADDTSSKNILILTSILTLLGGTLIVGVRKRMS